MSIRRRDALTRLAAAGIAAFTGQHKTSAQNAPPPSRAFILDSQFFEPYVHYFNEMLPEEVINYIPNAGAFSWMAANIPFFVCPDKNVEQTYYYRWWAYRKHIKQTPAGFIITEFLKPVKHASQYNALSCAFGHHLAEGRWLATRQYLDEYILFWLKSPESGNLHPRFHQFSGWASSAVYDRWLVDGNTQFLLSVFDSLQLDYRTWEHDRLLESGLFWQSDVADGMEVSISGGRKVHNARPTINSYMYGNAVALAAIADLKQNTASAHRYRSKAAALKKLVHERLWNKSARFFETLLESGAIAGVREEIGFTPWMFNLPDTSGAYEQAWTQLIDPAGFFAPYGPTTAEQRDSRFQIAHHGDDCQWNGPSWPFATTVTLKALANVLNNYQQSAISPEDYFETFLTYTRSHNIILPDGRRLPWVDEDLNPFTGTWLAREMKIEKGTFYGRGNHYNHSGYADLLITGLLGLRPRSDNTVDINPLLPETKWDWFCLDNLPYHGHTLTVLWDKAGSKFQKGTGFRLFADGTQLSYSPTLTRITATLPSRRPS